MSEMSGVGAASMSYAKEAYSANLNKEVVAHRGQQALDLLESASTVSSTPSASSGNHVTTDNLGQSVNIRV